MDHLAEALQESSDRKICDLLIEIQRRVGKALDRLSEFEIRYLRKKELMGLFSDVIPKRYEN